ncbi:coiled-coil domain-containing protein 25, variant 1 [Phytophthora nicotianae P1976]|uniref:Coiled-coil domain-containing protein 25, variant 1 n=1 Tax=Phytophthora nicotianae P1976 TaxID=1317066 RepID=A0A081AGY4_PHYNI|nr:coiled-coil domain-containing protein 25, variant 1 [Phytophthora nicotianae P1976]
MHDWPKMKCISISAADELGDNHGVLLHLVRGPHHLHGQGQIRERRPHPLRVHGGHLVSCRRLIFCARLPSTSSGQFGWDDWNADALAHARVLLNQGKTKVDDVSETCLEECAQLVKENSIEGSKKKSVSVCYTRWRNLKKTPSMEVGQVGFHHPERVRHYKVEEKNKDIIKMLNKTKQESHPDLEEERRQRELLYKAERKKQRLQLEGEQRKAKMEYKQQKDLRSYSSLLSRDNIESGDKLEAAADLSSVNAYEEDFM